jgi:hypothetical protein
MMNKLTVSFGIFLTCLFASLNGFSQLQGKRTLTANLIDDQKGVASAAVGINYAVWREGMNAWFAISYTDIAINANGGYWYKGKLYKEEVPGLMDLLRTGKASYPEVKFRVYYNEILQDTRTIQISSRGNNVGMLMADQFTLATTEDKLKNPAWRLEPVGMVGFLNTDWWYKAESLIESYEQGKKEAEEYKTLVQEADAAFNQKNYTEALKKYSTASRHKLADAYPGSQVEKVKDAMQKEKSTARFEELMKEGERAENAKNYSDALRQYEMAAKLGINDSQANTRVNRVRRTLDQLKRDEEERIKNEQAAIDKRNKETADKLVKDKEETDRIIKERDEKLQEELEQKMKEEAEKLSADEKKLFEENLKKQLKEQSDKWEQKKKEEKQKEEKQKEDRQNADNKLLSRFKKGMQWDPLKYGELVTKADGFFNEGMSMDPYAALELKNEWWDLNHYMKEFRDDLNEPRRQQAWEKCQNLLHEQEMKFNVAKYYYMEAIQYTDNNSWQYDYLLGKMKQMNSLIDIQKSTIQLNREGEEMRRENYKEAKAWAVINRQRDNSVRAQMAYGRLREQYIYPNHNYEGPKTNGNVIQQQANFENRLNAADQKLKQDNAVTGVTSQLVTNVLVDENKVAQAYGNGAMGLNLFAFTGGVTYPVVSNTEDNPDYVMQSFVNNLSVMPFTGGFDWWIRRSKGWDLALCGDFTFGVLPLLGNSNLFFSYGGVAKLNVGYKAVKLALEVDHHQRSGSYEFDEDVALQDNQFRENTNLIYTGEFSYSVLRLGGGLHFQLSKSSEDSYLRLLTYAEKPSFYQNHSFSKPVMSLGVQFMAGGGFTFNGSYAQNYPAAGTAKYMMRNYSTRDHWGVSLGKIWTIGKTH